MLNKTKAVTISNITHLILKKMAKKNGITIKKQLENILIKKLSLKGGER